MKLFDTHAHLTDKRFDVDRPELLASLPAKGIHLVIDVAEDLQTSRACLQNAKAYEYIYASCGFHPHNAKRMKDEDLTAFRDMSAEPKVKAIGEIGLDYHYDFSPRDIQRKRFLQQIDLALELDLPIIIHDREAHGDMLDILRSYDKLPAGVMHCFSGNKEMALECVSLGLYLSFAGPLTFENAKKTAEAAKYIPLDRLLVETDCPYLTPVPFRGKRNDPSLVFYTAEKLAAVHGKTIEEMAEITLINGKKLFGIA